MQNKKRVLFLCESYYRLPSPNGICIQKISEHLVNSGIDVDIITLFSELSQKEKEIINSVSVYRVDPGCIKRYIYINRDSNSFFKQNIYKLTLKLSAFNGMIHALNYPLLSKKQIKNIEKKALELKKVNNYDYIICVYQQIHPVLAGINLKKIFPNTKLILYTLDAISGGWVPTIMRSKQIPMRSLKRWEQYIFSNVDKIFIMDSHVNYYKKREYSSFKEKIEVLDIPLLSLQPARKHLCLDSKKHLVFTGTMSTFTANPIYFFEAVKYLDEDIVIDIYGKIFPDILKQLNLNPEFGKKILYHGMIEHNDIIEIQNNADVLLNFGNSNPNMIPSKIFEYMSTRNKIITFTHSNSDSSLPYLKKYENILIIDENNCDIRKVAEQINQFVHENSVKISNETMKKSFYKNTPEYFKEKLLQCNS
ncbi:hypothetical protein [Thomasclavelia sp.]